MTCSEAAKLSRFHSCLGEHMKLLSADCKYTDSILIIKSPSMSKAFSVKSVTRLTPLEAKSRKLGRRALNNKKCSLTYKLLARDICGISMPLNQWLIFAAGLRFS